MRKTWVCPDPQHVLVASTEMFILCSGLMFDPKFDETAAIFIIWARSRKSGMRTLAAGGFNAMAAA